MTQDEYLRQLIKDNIFNALRLMDKSSHKLDSIERIIQKEHLRKKANDALLKIQKLENKRK